MNSVFKVVCVLLASVIPVSFIRVRLEIMSAGQVAPTEKDGGGQGPSIR